MSDQIQDPAAPPQIPENVGKILLEPLNYAFAAGERRALEQGVPAHSMIEMLLNHLASVAAMIEPPGAREALIKQLVASIAPMIEKHVEARRTTPSGLVLPRAVN